MRNMFVFDLDGTIIIDNKMLYSILYETLKSLEKREEKIVFATSRSLRGVKKVLPKHLLNHPLILCNGAFAVLDNEVIAQASIPKEVYEKICYYLEKNNIPFYLDMGNEIFIPKDSKLDFFKILKEEAKNERVYYEWSNIRGKVYKIGVITRISSDILKKIEDISEKIKIYQHTDKTIDIVPENCSKWKMLQELGLTADVKKTIVFGNDANDMEMIQNADIGVAVCSSNKKLCEVADMRVFDNSPESLVKKIEDIYELWK